MIQTGPIVVARVAAENDYGGYSQRQGPLYGILFDDELARTTLQNPIELALSHQFQQPHGWAVKYVAHEERTGNITGFMLQIETSIGRYSLVFACRVPERCTIEEVLRW